MHSYNEIWVLNKNADKVLMCKRRKEPYKGLYNLVGGKIETDEDGFEAAYRELEEETGIAKGIELYHLMDFTYLISACRLEVYFGKLEKDYEDTIYLVDIQSARGGGRNRTGQLSRSL